ncbi:hypothetical protein LZ32DRAFT_309608 [Colletotrichum eremochloae]|nr:hypothetical protein LZ32DRAFT_309608 [Colletotrichum eremochloae]
MVGPGEQGLDSIEPTSIGDSSHLIASESKRSQNSFDNDTEDEAKVKAIDCSTAPKTDPNLNKAAHKIGVAVDDPETNDGEKEVEFDVVAIHGLCGQSRATWSARDPDSPEKTWLPDAFSWDSNIGRVILYGYDTDDVSIGCSTVGSVYREAVALLEGLSVLREPAAKVAFHTLSPANFSRSCN